MEKSTGFLEERSMGLLDGLVLRNQVAPDTCFVVELAVLRSDHSDDCTDYGMVVAVTAAAEQRHWP